MAKKLYYKIGEACKSLDIQPYVLRYWETEFAALKPNKSKSGQRVYSEQDLAVIRRIKELLYDEGYTIAGAKKKLDGEDLAALQSAAAAPVPKEKAEEAVKAHAKQRPEPAVEQTAPKQAKKTEKEVKKVSTKADSASLSKETRATVERALAETRAILALLDKGPGKS